MKILKIGKAGCEACKIMKPLWEEIEKENPDLETEYFEADDNLELIKKYDIRDVPCFIFLEDGKEVDRFSGTCTKQEILDKLKI